MEILQVGFLLIIFITLSVLMFLRKLPALIVLPIMAVSISLIGGVTFEDTLKYVIGLGVLKLSNAYTIAIFGSMLSVLLQKTGVAENFIKIGAELSGDRPWIISFVMLLMIILLFSILGGLGAIIMVATIVLPIMSSVGIGPLTTVGIFLFGLSIGGILNVGNWAVYINVMQLSIDDVRPFALIMFLITFSTALIYITIQLFKDGHDIDIKKIIIRSFLIIVTLLLLYFLFNTFSSELQNIFFRVLIIIKNILFYLLAFGIVFVFLIAIFRLFFYKNKESNEIHWVTFFSPFIPLILILVFSIDFIAAFIVGIIFTFIATYKKGRLNLLIQSMFEGGALVMPVVVLMFGIGMLLVSIIGPSVEISHYKNGWPVLNLLKPIINVIVPQSKFSYVFIFSLAAPLALYRGPLNVWGMGYGMAAVFLASGLNPAAVMGLLMSVGQVQGISDPTNTHNVWLANEMQVDVQKVLWNTIIYTWLIAVLGLIISSILFM